MRPNIRWYPLLPALALGLSWHAAMAAAGPANDDAGNGDEGPTYSVATGWNTSAGTYGTGQVTRITTVPVTVGVDLGEFDMDVRVPYTEVSGGTGVVPGVGATSNTNPSGRGKKGTGNSAQGLGDIVATGTWSGLYSETARAGIDITGKVKFGTASANKGLGTGQNDYTGALGFYQNYDRATLMLDLQYTMLGSSRYLKLNSGVAAGSLGGSFHLTEKTSLQLLANASGAASPTSGRSRDLTASVSHRLSAGWRCSLYALRGSGTGGPSSGAGANLSLSLP